MNSKRKLAPSTPHGADSRVPYRGWRPSSHVMVLHEVEHLVGGGKTVQTKRRAEPQA